MSLPFDVTKRNWTQRERLMMSEFLQKANLWQNAVTGVRLGQPPSSIPDEELSDGDRRFLKVKSRTADAVVFGKSDVTIIETKIIPRMGPLEALMVYKRLFLSDPDFAEHHKKRVHLWYVYAIEDPIMIAMAEEFGIRAIEYRPKWLPDYLKSLRAYERQGTPIARGLMDE